MQPHAHAVARPHRGCPEQGVTALVERDRVPPCENAQRAQRVQASGQPFEAVPARRQRAPREVLETFLEPRDVLVQPVQRGGRMRGL